MALPGSELGDVREFGVFLEMLLDDVFLLDKTKSSLDEFTEDIKLWSRHLIALLLGYSNRLSIYLILNLIIFLS